MEKAMNNNIKGIIVCGRGGSLGDFGLFAKKLKRDLLKKGKYKENDDIITKNIERRSGFFNYLYGLTFKVGELHIFSHSIGGGLFLSFGDPAVGEIRAKAFDKAQKNLREITYQEVLGAEVGAILTDHMIGRKLAKPIFAKDAKIKIWGCNSGLKGWKYSDSVNDGNPIVDPSDKSAPYYWRALNESHIPKPSIAQTFANFFKVPVLGASSGTNIQIYCKGKWISPVGSECSLGKVDYRLIPEKGSYNEYLPK